MQKYKDLDVLLFNSRSEFEKWILKNVLSQEAVWLKFAKKASKKESISYEVAREVALAHGWIDGLINKCDDDYYFIRFSHRRPKSIWSKINTEIISELESKGMMHNEGRKEAEEAKADGRWDKAY